MPNLICPYCGDEKTADDLLGCCGESSAHFVEACSHEGFVIKGTCENCGEIGLESDSETFSREAPR